MSEVGCLKDVHCQNLSVSGDVIIKQKVVDITTTPHVLDESQSGTLFTLNVGSDEATTITLPAITSSNIGTFYEFSVVDENSGGYNILTDDANDDSGDIYVGGLATLPSVADNGAKLFVSAVDNDSKIILLGSAAAGAGEIGSYIRVVAVKYQTGANHSHWMVTGIVGSDEAASAHTTVLNNV